jgi:hypothetical protein
VVKLLLNYGADINAAGFRGKTLLHLASSSQLLMRLLLKQRPELSRPDENGNIALHLLLQLENWWNTDIKTTIKSLLLYSADINIANNASESPLHLFVAQLVPGSREFIDVLIDFLDHNPNFFLPMPQWITPISDSPRKARRHSNGGNKIC